MKGALSKYYFIFILILKYVSVAYFACLITYYALSQIQVKNQQEPDVETEVKPLSVWTREILSGTLESEYFNYPILLIGESKDYNQPVILPIVLKTIVQCSISIVIAWVLALILNLGMISDSFAFKLSSHTINKTFNVISSFHIILIAFFLRVMFNELVPWYIITFSLILGSNVYYDISSELSNQLDEIMESDYYLMSRAIGSQPWKHILRPIASIATIQIFSMWPIVLTNTIIIEIILQVDGIGSQIFQHVIEPLSNGNQIDQNFLIAILTISIIAVSVIALIRDIMIDRISKMRS